MRFEKQTVKMGVLSAGLLSMLVLTGCQATQRVINKFDNGSLNYLQTQQLDPLVLPADQQTAPFTPLYPIPNIRENTVVITNEDGTRYELPPPFRSQTVSRNQAN